MLGRHKQAKAAMHRLGNIVWLIAIHGDAHQRHPMVRCLRKQVCLFSEKQFSPMLHARQMLSALAEGRQPAHAASTEHI